VEKFYALTENLDELEKKLTELKTERYIPPQYRLSHAQELKEEVIRPWLKQLPEVDIDGAHFPKSSTPFIEDSKLSVESAFLFDHFREHVCYKPDPFQLLESFKKKSGEFQERRLDLEGRISRYGDLAEKMLEASAGKVPATVREFAKWCRNYPSGSKLEKVEYLKELEKIGKKPFSTDARKLLAMFDELESLREKMRVVLEKHLHRSAPFPVECDLIRSGTL